MKHLLLHFWIHTLRVKSPASTGPALFGKSAFFIFIVHTVWASDLKHSFCHSNNNIPAHDNTGERSSQYAAENSCRTRYAPFTEWIAAFDTDEYLIPMGKYTSLKDVVKDAQKGGTNILSFRSSRAKLRYDYSQDEGRGRAMLDNATFLDAYNCDSSSLPKPSWADRARKQIYRADYVKYHFVHYATVRSILFVWNFLLSNESSLTFSFPS